MLDMSAVIVPKSDQINADDLIGGPRTITIRDVKLKVGDDQPCSIYFEGSEKAFRPCKGMRSLLVQVWGPDAAEYIGKSLTVYRDPKITFGADTVGGIRISHMSHLKGSEMIVPITLKRGIRKGWKVAVLKVEQSAAAPDNQATEWVAKFKQKVAECADLSALGVLEAKAANTLLALQESNPNLHREATDVFNIRRATLEATVDGFAGNQGLGA